MNKIICPLSEEFLYCSPELPEKGCYRALVETQQPMRALQNNYVVGDNSHLSQKIMAYKRLGINWLVKNIAQFVISISVIGITAVILIALLTLAVESI